MNKLKRQLSDEELDKLVRSVVEFMGYRYELVCSASRKRDDSSVFQRRVIICAIKNEIDSSQIQLGRVLKRNPSGVWDVYQQHLRFCAENPQYIIDFDNACSYIKTWLSLNAPGKGRSLRQINMEDFSNRLINFVYGKEVGYRIRAFGN